MRWYDLPVLRRFALSRFSFMRSGWHPDALRLARARALYWTLVRGHDSEICLRCGAPVRVVYWAPDELWERCSGFEYAARNGSEAGSGVLCPYCLDALAGWPLYWTCSRDEMVMPHQRTAYASMQVASAVVDLRVPESALSAGSALERTGGDLGAGNEPSATAEAASRASDGSIVGALPDPAVGGEKPE